ncbi:MAG: DUF4266 domain-containing protein [Bacteroidales bacterium]|nr:DUF4266 domain-containing protein [Bacteroidales bacterium]
MKRFLVKYVLFLIGLVLLILSSCVSLKPYERIYVNDPDMQMEADAGQQFGNYIHSIRESGRPAGSQVSSGGCGCR